MAGSTERHVVPVGTYTAVFVALLVLTAVTVGVAFLDLGPLNTVAALAIATTKAVLVVLIFMHVKYSTRLTRVVVLSGVYWWMILMLLSFSDYWTRAWRTYG